MKRLGIVTYYNGYNCGTYLQAYAMQELLKIEGYIPFFLKNEYRNDARLLYRLAWCARYLCTGDFKKAEHIWKVYRGFRHAHKAFTVTTDIRKLDAVVYGSDTIWDYTQYQNDESKWKRFWGVDYDGKKIAYAVSIGSAPIDKLLQRDCFTEQVNKFMAISVRDNNTHMFVEKALRREAQAPFVCDPTMLLSKGDYEKIAPTISEKGYILIYYFGKLSDSIKKQVRIYAEQNGKKIIAFGSDFGWADIYIPNNPFLMLSYYQHADFVITNTFHGNIFSLIFNKPFISLGKEKEKVVSLLSQFGVADRLADPSDDIKKLFETEVDFERINEKVFALREDSLQYLRTALIK